MNFFSKSPDTIKTLDLEGMQVQILVLSSLLLVASLCCCPGRAQVCSPPTGVYSTCVCDTGNGIIDLTALGDSSGSTASFSINFDGHDYLFNPCYGLSFGDESCSSDTAVCQHTGGSQPRSCGRLETQKILLQGSNARLQYTGGNGGRETIINLICDKSADSPRFTGVQDFSLLYEFDLTSKCVCPDANCHLSQSGTTSAVGAVGIVLIVLSLVGIVAYFVCGTLIMKIKFEKTGVEMIPQKNFWFSLPFLVKDGVIFTFSPLIRLVKKDTIEYEKQ